MSFDLAHALIQIKCGLYPELSRSFQRDDIKHVLHIMTYFTLGVSKYTIK